MDIRDVERWGVDFGNVLVQKLEPSTVIGLVFKLRINKDSFSDATRLKTIDEFLVQNSALVYRALEGLKTLIRRVGNKNVWIVSRAEGIERQVNSRLLVVHGICSWTGLLPENVIYVDKRAEKAKVCQKFQIDGHIDDRGEVLFHLEKVVPTLIWFAPTSEDYEKWISRFCSPVIVASNWDQLLSVIDNKPTIC